MRVNRRDQRLVNIAGGLSGKPNKATKKAKGVNTVVAAKAPANLSPYDIFIRCIKRAENLINFHSEDKNPDEEHFCDAYRASVVLSIAALDAYTRTVAIEKIKEKLRKKPKLSDPLCVYLKEIMTHESLLECAMSDSFFTEIENQISSDFQKKSFQGERKITHYMQLAGYKNIIGMVSEKNGTNEKNLKKEIDAFTLRRHTIAHGGDYDINKVPFQENTIKKEYAVKCLKVVSEFTETLNEICFPK